MSKRPCCIFLASLCLLLLQAAVTTAQNSLRGRITESLKSAPVPGASIYIPDLKAGAVATADGSYQINNIPAGTFLVEISHTGYARHLETIRVNGAVTRDFSLQLSSTELKEVIVTGVLGATDNQKNPIPVTVMPKRELLQNSSSNIIDAITRIPGVSAITDGQSIAKPVIRGLGYNRVVTVVDGVTQQGQQWGDEFGIEADPFAVNRVEILKGPASLAYGSDALSGVVNLLPEPVLPAGQTRGDVLLGYQTNNGLYNGQVHMAGNQGGVFWNARFDNSAAHAYQNKYDGYVLNSQFSNLNFDGGIGLQRKWGYTKLHYSFFNLHTGIVDGTRDSATGQLQHQVLDDNGDPIFVNPTTAELKSYTPEIIKQNVHHQKLVWDSRVALGSGELAGTFAWQKNRRQENNDPTIPDISNIHYLLNSFNYDLRWLSPTRQDFNYSVGVNGIYQDSKNKGTLLLIPEYNLFNIGVFAIANKKIGNLNLSGGLRYDSRRFQGHDNYIDADGNELPPTDPNAIHRFTAYTSNFDGVSASLGAAYQLGNNFYVKANIARGFRAANVAESGSNGIHDGTVVYEIGDPGLKPETNLELDGVLGYNGPDLTAELDLFTNTISHYIYPQSLKAADGSDSVNSTTPGFGDAPVFKYTQGKARLSGGEFLLDLHPQSLPWLDWNLSYSGVNALLLDAPGGDKYPPFIPPARLQSELRLSLARVSKGLANGYFKIGLQHSFEQAHVYNASAIYQALSDFELAASQAPTKAYTLLSAGAGTDFVDKKGRALCSVYLTLTNIFDTAYMDYMSRFKYGPANLAANPVRVGVFNMGRNFGIKILVPLQVK